MRAGREPAVFAREMTRHLRNVLIACAGCANLLDVSDEDAARYAAEAEAFGAERALRAMDLFRARGAGDALGQPAPDAAGDGRGARLPPAFDESVQALTERLDALERKLASGAYAVPAGQAAPAGQSAPAGQAAPAARRARARCCPCGAPERATRATRRSGRRCSRP